MYTCQHAQKDPPTDPGPEEGGVQGSWRKGLAPKLPAYEGYAGDAVGEENVSQAAAVKERKNPNVGDAVWN